METVGIIGGLGPETTAQFYLEVSFGCVEKNKICRPPILLWSVPIKYGVEKESLINGNIKKCLPLLIDAAKRLEQGGADFLVMPCNTLHVFIEEIRKSVKIPILSIVEETVEFLQKQGTKCTGILATPASIKLDLYGAALSENEIEVVTPEVEEQENLGKIIYNIVNLRQADEDKKFLLEIIDKFANKKVDTVILACTDLQLLISEHPRLKVYDTMKILVDSTVNRILK